MRAEADWNVLDPDVLGWRLEAAPREQLVRELFELRRILEPAIAARAAEKASAKDIQALAAAYAAMERSADDNESFIEPDTDFHKTIVRSVENRMVDALGSVIEAALTISLRLSLNAPDGQRPSLPLHKKVLDAIQRRDRTGAARAMELLIDNAQQDALTALGAERVPSVRKAQRMSDSPRKLRSQSWFGGTGKNAMMHRSWMKNEGMPAEVFDGRPVIGICNTWSELTPCNAHLRELAESVRRGVLEAGGFPVEFPVMSLGESNLRPTAMLFRNLASMDVEESIRGNPIDGVVLLVGCDKTTPALLMGAASCGLPTIAVSGGPMLNGRYKGREVGSGTDVWRFGEEVKAGKMTLADSLTLRPEWRAPRGVA